MINEQDYIKTEKDDGTIIFTPKKKEVTGERRRVELGEEYFHLDEEGYVRCCTESEFIEDEANFNYGNYYHTEDQAKAVADLRRHVYKFPVADKGNYMYYRSRERWIGVGGDIKVYSFDALPATATKEDQEERSRLIKRCYELNGYVSI